MVCSHCGGGSSRWHSHPSSDEPLCHDCFLFMRQHGRTLPELPPQSKRNGDWRRQPQQQPARQGGVRRRPQQQPAVQQPAAHEHQPSPPLLQRSQAGQQPQQHLSQLPGQQASPERLVLRQEQQLRRPLRRKQQPGPLVPGPDPHSGELAGRINAANAMLQLSRLDVRQRDAWQERRRQQQQQQQQQHTSQQQQQQTQDARQQHAQQQQQQQQPQHAQQQQRRQKPNPGTKRDPLASWAVRAAFHQAPAQELAPRTAEGLASLKAQWSNLDANFFQGGVKPAFEEAVTPVVGSLLALTCTDTYDAALDELERLRGLPFDLRRITIQCHRCHTQLAWTCHVDEEAGTHACIHCNVALGSGGKELRLVAVPVLRGARRFLQRAKAAGVALPAVSLESCQPECRQLFSGGAAALLLPALLAKLLALPEGETESLGTQAKKLWHTTFGEFTDAVASRQPGEDLQPGKMYVSAGVMRCVGAVCDAASARAHATAAQDAAEQAAAAASSCSAAAAAVADGGRGARRLVDGTTADKAAAKAAGEAAEHAKAAADNADAALHCARGAQRLADQLHIAAAAAAEQAEQLVAAVARGAKRAAGEHARQAATAAAAVAAACSDQAGLAAAEAQAAAVAGAAAAEAAAAAEGSAQHAAEEEATGAGRPQAAHAKQNSSAGKRGQQAAGGKRQQGATAGGHRKRPRAEGAQRSAAALGAAHTVLYALLLFFCTKTNCLLNLDQTGAPGLLAPALQAALGEQGLVRAALAFSLVPDVDQRGTETLILGGAGSATGWHRDWSAAYNLALAVCSGAAGVLATWFFCPPGRQAALDLWLKTNTKASCFAATKNLSEGEWRALEAAAAGLGLVRKEQRAGQLMFVPAGWPHYVRNECENVKVAWDVLELRHLHLCLRALQDVSVPRKNEDYMLAQVFAVRFLSALFGVL